LGCCGGGAIELMEPIRLAPERVEERFSGSRPRIHHVAYAVPAAEVADLRRSLDERGLSQYLSSQIGEVETTSTTPPPFWATTSRSTPTARACATSSGW
jgi:hypothetical protein